MGWRPACGSEGAVPNHHLQQVGRACRDGVAGTVIVGPPSPGPPPGVGRLLPGQVAREPLEGVLEQGLGLLLGPRGKEEAVSAGCPAAQPLRQRPCVAPAPGWAGNLECLLLSSSFYLLRFPRL